MKGLAAAAAFVALLLVPLAAGHAEPYQSDPPGGARLEQAPQQVSVSFTEPVYRDGSWIRVLDTDGERVDLDDLVIEGDRRPTMTISLPSDLPDGAYRISWQTYSVTDGHTIRGSIGFAVGGFAPPASTSDAEGDLDLRAGFARALLYAGFALGIGAIAYGYTVNRRPWLARMFEAGSVLAVLGTAALLHDTWQGTGLAFGAFLDSDGGRGLLQRLALAFLLFLLTAVLGRGRPQWQGTHAILGMGWLGLAFATARFGHVTQQGGWATLLELVHLVAVAAWIGGLVVLIWDLRTHDDVEDMRRTGLRFSKLAAWSVAALAATGIAITALLVGDLLLADRGLLFSDSWAWFLTAKVGLTLLMLGLAGINRYAFLDDRTTGGAGLVKRLAHIIRPDWGSLRAEGTRRAMHASIRIEAAFGALVIISAGLLLSVSPPTVEAEQESLVQVTGEGDEFIGLLEITPEPTVGESHTLRFYIQSDDQEPLVNNTCGRDNCVQAHWAMAGDNSTDQEATAVPEGDGWWRVEDALFVASGNLTVSLDIQTAYVYYDQVVFGVVSVG